MMNQCAKWIRASLLGMCFFLCGCATTRPVAHADHGPYPFEYERIVEHAIEAQPANGATRTVTSVTEPMRDVRDDIAGWAVWARVRDTRPNVAGGIDIAERDWRFLLRNGRVVLVENP